MDTIYAEGRRRYVESLSSYARQFLGQVGRPDVDIIEGLPPAIAIDQRTADRNPRSTVGTVTEVHDYLRLLYARIGSPLHQLRAEITRRLRSDGRRYPGIAAGARVCPRPGRGRATRRPGPLLDEMRRAGFARARIDGEVRMLDESIDLARSRRIRSRS